MSGHRWCPGRRNLRLLTSRVSPNAVAVRTGWAGAMSELGLNRDDVPEVSVPPYGSTGWVPFYDDLLDRCTAHGVSAVLGHSDREAIGLLERAGERGLRVPGDLSVVSYDDEVAAVSDPPLTAVRPEKHHIGRTAVELALGRLAEGVARPVHRVTLWPRLVVRGSCGAGEPSAG